jgi:hypothetical protein
MNAKGINTGKVAPEQDYQKLPCKSRIARDGEKQMLSYEELLTSFKKSLRNGNWRHLNPLDKALYRASLWYAKHRGSIVNVALAEKLSALAEKLKETKGMRIFKRGFKKAVEMLEKGEEQGQEQGVFTWAPQLKHWLKDPDYIFWLGTMR